ncbi:MAG: hypothetical protein SOZ23_06165 [Methanosphaera sp.]|uniref:hypothetical protein n=1 Tax=Methanosphaera sp. TaxID=2666342 RepID=UPI0025D46548|nr:hypothetical protein [Methanosphaera sp.]MCI5866750.1 hypothetical protein [Methanosphaera sp.]MDD6534264.1 hypothetical protein [Methanosphaera sp.]MDY3956351.1 hypothetical protein [Methanosphaera sp.]
MYYQEREELINNEIKELEAKMREITLEIDKIKSKSPLKNIILFKFKKFFKGRKGISDDFKNLGEEAKIKYIIRILSYNIEEELDEYSEESYDIEALTKEQCEIWDVNLDRAMYVINLILDGSVNIDDILNNSFDDIGIYNDKDD